MILLEFGIELAPMSPIMTYTEAKLYCWMLTYDGKIGWRLPRFEEYSHLTDIVVGWYENCVLGDEYAIIKLQTTPVRDLR
jgi:hypothetical protein